jgi:alpha-methylacyl-CoA racemase
VAVAALEPAFFAQLLAGLSLDPGLYPQFEPGGWPAMQATFAGVFAGRSRDDWVEVFAGTDACVSPVLAFGEAADDAHNAARGTFVRIDGVIQPGPGPQVFRHALRSRS